MSQVVFLGLGDGDVDVLTRLKEIDPRPDVLVVDADPQALAIRLARLAGLDTAGAEPTPAPDDVLVSPLADDPGELGPWRAAGATIVLPKDFNQYSWASANQSVRQHAEVTIERAEAPVAPVPPPPISFVPEETAPAPPPPAVEPPAAEPPSVEPPARTEAPSSEMLESPEASFRFLVREALGEDADAVLWWDAGEGVWTPWVSVGAFDGEAEMPAEGAPVQSPYGSFQVTGSRIRAGRWNSRALSRVAEDMALRERVRWEGRLATMRGAFSDDAPRTEAWWKHVAGLVEAESLILWKRDGKGWSLDVAVGDDIQFSGRLLVAESVMESLTPATGRGWRRWIPSGPWRGAIRFAEGDLRWRLHLARLQNLMGGDDAR